MSKTNSTAIPGRLAPFIRLTDYNDRAGYIYNSMVHCGKGNLLLLAKPLVYYKTQMTHFTLYSFLHTYIADKRLHGSNNR